MKILLIVLIALLVSCENRDPNDIIGYRLFGKNKVVLNTKLFTADRCRAMQKRLSVSSRCLPIYK